MDDLLAEFLTETQEALGELDLALVRLEQTPDDRPTLALIFRLVHTIKGTCGFLGLPRLEAVAHAAENVLGQMREQSLAPSPAVINAVLAAIDRIKLIIAGLESSGQEPPGDDSALLHQLTHLDTALAGGAPSAPAEPAVGLAAEHARDHTPDHAPEVSADAPQESGGAVQTIRVNVDVLEELMTLVGELVLTRNQLLQLSRANGTTALSTPLQRLSHITTDLQEGVMKTRMQPIGNAWNKLPRLVRDLLHETQKKITLTMRGQDTELDRQVLELMRDPLTHMVRNSADHGLETPAERRAAGKAETGSISLNAYHEGGHIIIEIADDGRGLDAQKISAKALAQGLASEAELAAMPEAQIQGFIFRPGFSTAAQVTSISGRGVGMDVVRTNIEQIGGTVDVSSTPGQGACFTIKIPLTLAIVSALIVRAGEERFAIPQIGVKELVRVAATGSAAQDAAAGGEHHSAARGEAGSQSSALGDACMVIERIGQTPVLRLRDRLLPLVSLSALLLLRGPDGDAPEPAGAASAHPIVVVTQAGSGLLGILVDDVFDTEEIVVKPVAPILRHVTMFSGNTILGDGSVIMILDPNGIARAAGLATRAQGDRAGATALPAAQVRGGSQEQLAMLLFRAGGAPTLRAVPLNLVARLEAIPREAIETVAGGHVTQYRGRLMPLIAMPAQAGSAPDAPRERGEAQPVLVFADGERLMGLMVDMIVDVVHDHLQVQLGSERAGLLGSAVIAGQACDVLDTAYWLTQAAQDWFGQPRGTAARGAQRVLVVEDSDFFRQMLVPVLGAGGYEVIAAADPGEALRLRDSGLMVDAIISDIEMPGMSGLEFAQLVRAGGPWAGLPMIALSGRITPADAQAGRDAGFNFYVAKFDRAALRDALSQALHHAPNQALSQAMSQAMSHAMSHGGNPAAGHAGPPALPLAA